MYIQYLTEGPLESTIWSYMWSFNKVLGQFEPIFFRFGKFYYIFSICILEMRYISMYFYLLYDW